MNVRHIYLGFDDETKSAATMAYGEDKTSEYEALLDSGKAALQAKIDDIEARLDAGEDFGTLMEEYNEDAVYSMEPYSTEGVEVGPYKSNDILGYLDAVATLTKNGQVSEPLVNYNGVYFIQCVKMLAGVVPYEDVKEDMTSSMLAGKQQTEWSTVAQGWVDAGKAAGTLKIYPDRY
jgi:foldase protein PrsA